MIYEHNFLTTEGSEVVPFLRAVRGEKEESRSDLAERSEGATNWEQGSPEFASFHDWNAECCDFIGSLEKSA